MPATPASPPQAHRWLSTVPGAWWVRNLLLALAYAAVGQLGLVLALPPSYASPLYPAAGVALAALICWGPRLAPGVALGGFIVNVLLAQDRGLPALLAPTLVGLGAALQALAGAWAVRRLVGRPVLLSEPRDLASFYLIALLSCLVSATVGSLALLLGGAIGPRELAGNWGAWWLGDTLGVMIGTPVALTLFAQPRQAWAPRRVSVALPLLVATLLMGLASWKVNDWDQQRERASFERDATAAADLFAARLREPIGALQATQGLLMVAPELNRETFERATRDYLLPGGNLLALGWAAVVQPAQIAGFDAAARADGLTGYAVHERGSDGDLQPDPGEARVAIRLIEPLPRNALALGVNIQAIPASRHALRRAWRGGLPQATEGFQLSQDRGASVGVVMYQAVYSGQPTTVEQRLQALRGVVFVTVKPEQLLASVAAAMPSYLAICLVDTDPLARFRRLAGPPGCEQRATDVRTRLMSTEYGGRQWDVLVYAPEGVPDVGSNSSRAFAIVGLMCTSLLGALLLMVTGRARRVEALVQERTQALEHEVQERERAAQALVTSEQRFRNIFDNVPIGLVFADINGRPQEINPHFCAMLGYSVAQLQGMRSLSFTHPDDRAEDVRLGRQLLAGEIALYRRRKRYLARDGHIVHARIMVSMLRDASGAPYRLVGVVEDITDQLRLEDMQRARDAAEAASRAKNEFLSRMSHELRTPLNAMLGFTQLLELDQAPALSERQLRWTRQVQHAGWHLLEMINDILDLSRIESGAVKLSLQRQDLQRLLTESLSLVQGSAAQRGIAIEEELDEDARQVLGDATRIKQVLTNLLSNAVKYNREGGSIRIRCRRVAPDRVELTVSDTGLGMSAAQLTDLFQPFNRLGREASDTEGSGIGLVISKRLAELMGGGLSASSEPDAGSCFTLHLPVPTTDEAAPAAAPEASDPTARGATPSDRPGAASTSAHRVVYIEDNAVNVEVMRGLLAGRPGLELEVYGEGRAGLKAVLAAPPDLLLLDMQLPDIDGFEILGTLRATARCASLPVVVVSANAMPEQVRRCMELGASHYLTKPVNLAELTALLDRLLPTRAGEGM